MLDSTYYVALHPLFVTSAAATDKVIDDFLQASADRFDFKEEYNNTFSFSLQRTRSDASKEIARVAAEAEPMHGTQPPVGPNAKLDFEGASLGDLTAYVIETFAADDFKREGDQYVALTDIDKRTDWGKRPRVDIDYFAVLDERSARDRSYLIIEVPKGGPKFLSGIRSWVKRDSYEDLDNWTNDTGWHTELKAVRAAFTDGDIPEKCIWNGRRMVDFADQQDEHGVYSEAEVGERIRRARAKQERKEREQEKQREEGQ